MHSNIDPAAQTDTKASQSPAVVTEATATAAKTAAAESASAAVEPVTRFAFGDNWERFLQQLTPQRIESAAQSLDDTLGGLPLAGKRFLDIGSGSGLFSLAAHRAGAVVTSFDDDPQSVACTNRLRQQFAGNSDRWTVHRGSVLDADFIGSLGTFDVVYSWGVLHHTGDLWRALDQACRAVADDGWLAIALYHDQGGASRRWAAVKRFYQALPAPLQPLWVATVAGGQELKSAVARLASGRNPLPFTDWRQKSRDRGMSVWHDWVDWVGGWPFQIASPDAVINPLIDRGWALKRLKTVGHGWGCNEYLFVNSQRSQDSRTIG